ncbi:hypothetical protein MYSTI_02653 [Myxococcus stipitatus DSM 14675]|uniref:Uncharacterized protein n=1 Tax=Myxococcus stipitatus (strain DSM 14675 / JCM 12634 / Mx s8) TaxID=1278073 RepID=L7UBZ7_MYXSD|nr:hypothetical protein [Myxococcus stipitatus]AGC43969.1 hypothetical protein MYSTI_02653 [Myxococcus stipitatus DSM 14675]
MGHEGRLSPVELLRRVTFSLEQLAVQGLASGVVRGASAGLQAELPALDGQLRALIEDGVALLARIVEAVADKPPGTWTRTMAQSAVSGAVEELRRSMPGVDALSRELVERVNAWLDRSSEAAALHNRELREPGARARELATGAVKGVVKELETALPALSPMGAQVASQAGRGFIQGFGEALEARSETFDEVLDEAGRRLVHAVVEQLDQELRALRARTELDVGGAVASMAERTASATVRGASEELRRQVRATREAGQVPSLRTASREVTLGVLSALSERLLRPLAVMTGVGGALALTAFTLTRRR